MPLTLPQDTVGTGNFTEKAYTTAENLLPYTYYLSDLVADKDLTELPTLKRKDECRRRTASCYLINFSKHE